MHYVAVLHDIVFALDGNLAGLAAFGLAAQGHIVVIFYHLGAYEAALEVAVYDAGCLRGFHAFAEGPGTALFGAGGQEGLQAQEVKGCFNQAVKAAFRFAQILKECLGFFGIELCEDLWAPIPPSSNLALAGADIIFNLSASNDVVGKRAYLMQLLCQQSARCLCGYVYVAAGFGESTQDTVFSGKAMILENGTLLAEAKPHSLQPQLIESEIDVERIRAERRLKTTFAACGAHMAVTSTASAFVTVDTALLTPRELELTRPVAPHPFVHAGRDLDARCEEIFAIQTEGLAKRLRHTGSQTAVIGISGGLDSTLALLVCVRAFDLLGIDRQGIVGVTMPGFGTSDRTHGNAVALMTALGIRQREINISVAVTQHFNDIGHDPAQQDVTYENSQARERTQILMDLANQERGIVVGTGDLSEQDSKGNRPHWQQGVSGWEIQPVPKP